MRNSGFQSRTKKPGNTESSFFGKRDRGTENFSEKRQGSMNVPDISDRIASIRRRQFSRLLESAKTGATRLAEITEMAESRVKSLADGADTIDSMLAYHIEEMIGLPHGWIENGTLPHIPDDVLAKLTADIFVPQEDVEAVFGPPMEVAGTLGEEMLLAETASPSMPQEAAAPEAVATSASQDAQKSAPVVMVKKSRRIAPLEEIKAATQVSAPAPVTAEPAADVAPTKEAIAQIARDNLVRATSIFPSMRQFLVKETNLSLSSISGSLTGSRALPLSNVTLYESVMGLPTGWLRSTRSTEEIKDALVAGLGEAIVFAPAPKRGPKPSADRIPAPPKTTTRKAASNTPAPVPAFLQPSAPSAPAAVASAPIVAEPVIQAAAPASAPTPSVSASDPAAAALLDTLVSVLQNGVAVGKIKMADLAAILNYTFERTA